MSLSGGSDTPWSVFLLTDPPARVEVPFIEATGDARALIAYLDEHYPGIRDVGITAVMRAPAFAIPRPLSDLDKSNNEEGHHGSAI